jgi:hypothetical protein
VERIGDIHRKTMLGLTAEEAEIGYLETAEKLVMYGVCAARITEDVSIGVCATGILGERIFSAAAFSAVLAVKTNKIGQIFRGEGQNPNCM